MASVDPPSEENRQSGGERRARDRRRVERRSPPPPWRRPWALVAYGAVAGVLLVWLMFGSPGGDHSDDLPIVEHTKSTAPPKAAPATSPGEVEAAFGASGFERLTLEGPAAVGRRVRTELYCEQPRSYQVREGVRPEAAVATLATDGRVPAAECKWGTSNDARREDFVLLVPPALASQFASAPVVTDQFQRRRRLIAEVEWLGRSEALALRPTGVFRGIVPR